MYVYSYPLLNISCNSRLNAHSRIELTLGFIRASQVVLVVKKSPVNAGDTRNVSSISGSGRSPEKEMATHYSILAWKIPWTGEPDRLQSIGSQRVGHN